MAENNNIPQFVTNESFMADNNYIKWLSDLKKRIRIAQLKAAVRVNEEMLKLYWSIGEDICEKQKQHHWGTAFIKRLSADLRTEFPHTEGFSWSNLYKIRQWYLYYSAQIEFLYQAGTKLLTSIMQQPVAQLDDVNWATSCCPNQRGCFLLCSMGISFKPNH